MAADSSQAGSARWRNPVRVLAEFRSAPDATRAAIAQKLGLTTGQSTMLAAQMRSLGLLTEAPAPISGRGRPTTVFRPHPDGPVVLTLRLGARAWSHAVATVDGRLHRIRSGPLPGSSLAEALAGLRDLVTAVAADHGDRLAAVSVAVGATPPCDLEGGHRGVDWRAADLADVTAGADVPLLAGSDAALRAIAEARTGSAVTATTALHVTVEAEIAVVVTTGEQVVGGTRECGEGFGHLPFGDPSLVCRCGARGCWVLEASGLALARQLGADPARLPDVVAEALRRAPDEAVARRAVASVAAALGAGVAGLVNAHNPDLITLGGYGPALRAAAGPSFRSAFRAGLMKARHAAVPRVLDVAHTAHAALLGAAHIGLERATGPAGLEVWAARHERVRGTARAGAVPRTRVS